jgi:large subunit ribosomal protein L6
MSRVGRLPIPIPQGVTVLYESPYIKVKGPKGELVRKVEEEIQVTVEDGKVWVKRSREDRDARSLHGLTRTLINNMIFGVTRGFEKTLEIEGVGYRSDIQGDILTLSLGYSHPIKYQFPVGIKIKVDKQTKVTVEGIDKYLVGEVAAKIRRFRKPDVYKGKGVKYAGEVIKKKVGKTGATK